MAMAAAGTPLLSLFFFLISASLLLPGLQGSADRGVLGLSQREFDYLALALQWPGTYCQSTHYCCPSNGCCRPYALTQFTIHGLWPDYDDGTWPACCSSSEFDVKKISSLIPTLEKYWPSLSCSSASLCHGGKGLFWGHEYEKHGTCSYPVIQDEYSYFSKALDLYFKYNITDILSRAGFLATNSETYFVKDIVAALEKAIGTSPQLVCKRGSLQELRICFYKDFTPRDCGILSSVLHSSSLARSSCPKAD
ncbi:ribonuclease 2 [Dioscorea cayenensis subsp. rotundata]|uniref:Ribonuclease 2 n=1 Tax=Dioscorea cayennensis subsp. rotundata TaxID=55577 RepID=A0AB40B785_DIOCR|nr:ribonuclease 2 [Dioscorea cayenensis subsp. rotundata]